MRTSCERDAFETALQGAFDFCCYYLGRAVILLGTLGRLKCDPLFAFVPRRKLRDCGLHHRRGGQLYITREGTHVVGSLAGLVLVCSVGHYDLFDKQRENIKRFGLSYLALQSFEKAPAQPPTTEE